MAVRGSELEDKKIFLIVSGDAGRRQNYTDLMHSKYASATVYQATDGSDALFKIRNSPPHILIIEPQLTKLDGIEVVRQILAQKQDYEFSIVILGPAPDTDIFVDEIISGRVQFFAETHNEAEFDIRVTRALNRAAHTKQTEYTLHFLAPGEYLFHEGDVAQHVFIVRRGRLRALKTREEHEVVIGEIEVGEFVGEMAHINHEPRSATIQAIDDCELIEIPNGSLDMVLFSRPAWAQALVATLSRRLRITSEALAQKSR
jgi:CRP/FNR family cyclic AMP-dependent transcriptional regulator